MSKHILLSLLVFTLTACSGGSGVDVVDNVDTGSEVDTGIVYTGPAPQTDDVQQFKLAVWDQLVELDRCGACHNESQTPRFVRADDVNLAYSEIGPFININSPSESVLATKVSGGHNCWLDVDSVCGDIITGYIEDWLQSSDGGQNEVVLTAPEIHEVGTSKSFPDDSTDFAATHAILNQYCSACHTPEASLNQQPYIASSDIDVAYEAAQPRIDLSSPADSRLVERLRSEFHNCWSDCSSNADELEAVITVFADTIPETTVPEDLTISKALTLTGDGIVASSGGRVENNLIALYEFKAGIGGVAYDTSGVEPAANLNLIGDVSWLGSYGLRIEDGKAQASTASSKKLYDLITATGEYSIEAWVIPGNVSQDGPARIVTYAGSNENRNFMLGQTLYNYDFLNRNDNTDANGSPALSTDDDAELLQATLQHVVVSYSSVDGRRIYVNGEYTGDADSVDAGGLTNWDDSFALAIGNEVSNDAQWQGSVRLLAIYNRAISEEAIVANYDAGVGQKFFLLFSIAHLVDVEESYIAFEVQQFDDYSYLFNAPFFTVLGSDTSFSPFHVEGVRIGINGQEIAVGQAFSTLDVEINATSLEGSRQSLSSIGTVIALQNGADEDEFFLSFDRIASHESVRVEAVVSPLQDSADIPDQARIGLRKFAEVNYSLSAITGVDVANTSVAATYNNVRQQLPLVESVDGFLSAHQMGVTQLAVEYCNVLVGDDTGANTARSDMFGSFDFSQTPDSAFDTVGRAAIFTPLLDKLLAAPLAANAFHPTDRVLDTQPEDDAIETELNSLVDLMLAACPGECASQSDRTLTITKAVCAAATGSAVMLLQ